jgi:hypothetical protein
MARPAQSRRTASVLAQTGVALAGVLVLLVGTARDAFAPPNPEAVDSPRPDRVWGGCELGSNTVNAIKSASQGPGIGATDFSFGIVYARTQTNHGQPLTTSSGGGFTGPVICIPNKQTGLNIAIEKTTEEENIPTSEDQGVASVDLLDIAEALVERYRYPPSSGITFENRFCHTVNNPAEGGLGFQAEETSTDCFRIYTPPAQSGEEVGTPEANHVWAGCTLSNTTVNDIRSAIQAGQNIDKPNVEVSYLVVYSSNNPNNGQPLTAGGFTGPVICTAPAVPPFPQVLIEKTTESEDIPNSADQPGATSVDLLDISEALVLRYSYQPTGAALKKESRFCHTVAHSGTGGFSSPPPETNTDCFRIYPGS